MTNYNDGKWHGWNGGECPVHPETKVQVSFLDGEIYDSVEAYELMWEHRDDPGFKEDMVIAFRVIERCREPRDFWIVKTGMIPCIYDSEDLAKEYADEHGFEILHVREVIE